jgi:hypothetical protein
VVGGAAAGADADEQVACIVMIETREAREGRNA